MKKTIVLLSILAAQMSYAAVNQPNNIGSVKASKIVIGLKTKVELAALTPDTTGQLIGCSDCTRSAVCIGSGTVNAGSWVVLTDTGTFAGSTWSGMGHCQ